MSQLCQFKEHIDLTAREHTPQGIQDLLDELEAPKQARFRAWAVHQRLRALLCDLGNVTIDPPSKKTFDLEGAILRRT
jgi:hypothetical protein